MKTAEKLLELLLAQEGDEYIWAAEALVSDSDPDAFDCSELVEWGCARLGVKPVMPDLTIFQIRHCRNHGLEIEVDEAIDTPGALLFYFSADPFTGGRPSGAHVAVSLGNGKTIEARSSQHGVGIFSAENRGWTHAGLIPGLDYGAGVTTTAATTTTTEACEEGTDYRVTARALLDIRSGPGTNYDVVAELEYGDEFFSPDTTGWLPVIMEDNTTAWIRTKIVEEINYPPQPGETTTTGPTPEPTGPGLTRDQLQDIAPHLSDENTDAIVSALNLAMQQAEINTPLRQAAFIAQLAHESQGFTRFTENLNYRADRLLAVFGKYFTPEEAQEFAHQPEKIANRVYANRLGNGDEDSGDGWRYRGQGFIQLTGRSNYREAGDFLNLDLEGQPELAANFKVAARVAAWYWNTRDLNSYADNEQFDAITKRICGGYNGLASRRNYYDTAKDVLVA